MTGSVWGLSRILTMHLVGYCKRLNYQERGEGGEDCCGWDQFVCGVGKRVFLIYVSGWRC